MSGSREQEDANSVKKWEEISPEAKAEKLEKHQRNLKSYMSLFVMMLHFSALILTMRQSRMGPTDQRYIASTAVLCSECLKLTVCVLKSVYDIGLKRTREAVFGPDNWKLSIPALLYVVQNNLQYVAATNLDATTFQVSYQLKILTTAFFSVVMLKRSLLFKQWLTLLMLTLGVILVQLPDSFWTHALNLDSEMAEVEPEPIIGRTRLIGLIAVIISCVSSGLAGVYFEMVLKNTKSISLWVRNIQLALYSLIPAVFLGCWLYDGKEIAAKGFFHGYTPITYTVICMQAFGGILVAIVVKYADNILKNFATSLSIILSAIVSYVLWNTGISKGFIVGASMVIASTFLFGMLDQKKPR